MTNAHSTLPALDFVSPLPPVHSGIADYSRDLIPLLAQLCDLRLIRLPGQPAPEIAGDWPMGTAAETGGDGRLPLYQMGNNIHHEGVWNLALERPGILVLHDLMLHHLLVELTVARKDQGGYVERLKADHGWIGEDVGRARFWGDLGGAALFSLAANRTLLRRQRGVLVHSTWAAEELQRTDGELQIRAVPMAMPLPRATEQEASRGFREKLGLAPKAPLLGSFGFQTPIKRTEKVVAALARPGLEEAHLLIAGEISPAYDLAAAAEEIGVSDRVHVTGFLDYADFESAIAASDLCLNLRYPTAGETSASLLRVLAAGRATVVSEYGQFAELPDEVVAKVPLGEGEVEALAATVGELLAQPGRLEEMGRRAREYVAAEHDPGRAAAAVAEACVELSEVDPPGDAAPRVPPTTCMIRQDLRGKLEVEGAEPPWPVGEMRRLDIRLENGSSVRWLASRHPAGGVIVKVRWRRTVTEGQLESRWLELPRDLDPGESQRLQIELRRPQGGGALIVEPHLKEIGSFFALGGPVWVLEP